MCIKPSDGFFRKKGVSWLVGVHSRIEQCIFFVLECTTSLIGLAGREGLNGRDDVRPILVLSSDIFYRGATN